MDHPIAPLLLVSKLRNNRMVKMRENLGMSAPQIAEVIGVGYPEWIKLESLKVSPLRKSGQWRPIALKIADWFKVMPEDLWPAEALAVECSTIEREVSAEEAHLLMGGDAYQSELPNYQGELEAARLEEALLTLTPREERVLRMRYGIGTDRERLLKEVAAEFELSSERIRHIEHRAISKLRHPYQASILKGASNIGIPDESIVRCVHCQTPLSRKSPKEMFRCSCGKTTSEE